MLNTPAAWLAAGQALAHVLLVAADRGLLASYANQPVKVARLRPALAALVGGGFPQSSSASATRSGRRGRRGAR